MSTDVNVKAAPSSACSSISPVTVTPPGTMNCTNGAGLPYVVDACHDAPAPLIVRPQAECAVNGAPLGASPSKPITHGPGGIAGAGEVVGTSIGDAAVGLTGVGALPPHAARPERTRASPQRCLGIVTPPAQQDTPLSRGGR